MKKFLTYCLIGSLLWNNVAFATHQIIELDFKDSQTPQRLHVIPRMSNVGDVSHVEIDQEQQQVVVHKLNKADEGLSEQSVAEVFSVTSPIIIPKHDVQNLPWELESEKLTLFILNHNAWLSPLDKDGYKLEFRGSLLGGGKDDCQEECIHYEGVCFPMSVLRPFFPAVLGNLSNFVKEAALNPRFMTTTGKQPFLRGLRADAIQQLLHKPDYAKLRQKGQEALQKKVFGWMAAEVYEICKAKLIKTQQEYNLPHEVLLNTNGYLSIFNGITRLVYPIFAEDRNDPKNADKTYLIEPSILEKVSQDFKPSMTLGIEQHFNRIAVDYIQSKGGEQKVIYQREVAPIGKLVEESVGNIMRKTKDYSLRFDDTNDLQIMTSQILQEHLRRTELPASIGMPLIATVLQASPYMKDTVLDDPMREILQHYMEEKKVDPSHKVAFEPLFYTGRMVLRDILSQVECSRDYTLSYKKDDKMIYWTKDMLQSHLYQLFRNYTKATSTNGSTINLEGVDKDGAITWGLSGRLLYRILDLLKDSEPPVYKGSKYLLTQNKKGALSVSSPSNSLVYPLFVEDRSLGDAYLPRTYAHDGLLDKALLEIVYQYINGTLTKSPYQTTYKEYIHDTEPAFYIVRSALKNALKQAEQSYIIKETRSSREKQIQDAMINHLLLTPLAEQDNTFGNQMAEWVEYDMRSLAHQIYDGYSRDLGASIVSMVVHPRILDDVLAKVEKEKPELKHLRQILKDRGIQAVSNDPDFLMTLGYVVRHLVHNDLLGGFPFGQFLKTMVAEWSKPKIFSTPIREAVVKTLETPVEEAKPKVLVFPGEENEAKALITYPAEDTGMKILSYDYDVDIEDADKLPPEEVQKIHLRIKLQLEEAGLIDGNGQLTQKAIDNVRNIKKGEKLDNPLVIKELTKDGSKIEDWTKVGTEEKIILLNGKKADLHFYKHKSGKVNTNIDFKVQGIVPKD